MQSSHKESATSFLSFVSKGNIRQAFDSYVAPGFRHHNVWCKGDAASLAKAMEDNHAQFPHKHIEVKHVLEDGDLVMVHSRMLLRPEGPEVALCHLFQFKDDRIVELWDIGQPMPETCENENGMF